ncbi:Mismatch repair protein msh3 [Entomortierella chlamydospora]|uniref:DNA mismatch repair protein n=1 Tax=Entomortierella chlamydospora TaxID=101097 RepID=A0A9P6MXT5_9FUNG|nr:Mismatch repair protein msh3 [Entomortierella chlamydospora]KAG0016336.1 Mismatch repair protein msh3 [Entomortierella chlamydospora]
MVAQPAVQKTLLSFFKPKTDTSPSVPLNSQSATTTTTTTTNTTAATAPVPKRSSLPSKRKQNNLSSDNDRIQQKKRRARESSIDDNDINKDEPLFPAEFTNDIKRFAHASHSPPPNVDRDTTVPQTKATSTLSRFGYQVANADLDQSDSQAMDVDYPQANEERRERFMKKFGRIATPEATQESGLQLRTRSRRKLIISESEDEDDAEDKSGPEPGHAGGISHTDLIQCEQSQPQKHSRRSPKSDAASSRPVSSQKVAKSTLTPLEKQFVEIKDQYPDAILCIEVGYKFRFFGEDAEIASRELCIAHFMDHNFYTASIPTHRLDVHVRRLVHAGFKVGVVRQMETAALKSAGDNKSAPFTRKLTNLYTKATFLESLDQDDSQFQGGFVGRESSSQYLMCICEQPQGGSGADEKVKIAVLAVQPATGDIIYDEFLDGHFRNELETRLLHINPAELIVPIEPMSKATEKLLGHLTASTHRRTGPASNNHDGVRIERTNGFVKYDKAFSLVSEFYSKNLKEEQSRVNNKGTAAESSKQSQMETLLKTVLGLSRNLIIALAAMITHLTDFGLAPVFRLSKYFECFTSRSHMLLNGNTISNLEIYRNQTDWTTRGSLFSILDHTQTGFGRRLLRKWVGKPLVDRKVLQERVDAVEEILSSAGKNAYLEKAKGMLKGLVDLEKGVCRIHYGKSSPKEFLTILRTFKEVAEVIPRNQGSVSNNEFGLKSPVLRNLIGSLSNALEDSSYFLDGLNEQAARKDDKLRMFQEDVIREKWPEICEHRDNIVETEGDLSIHLGAIRKLLREPHLEYTTVSGIDYLVEVKNKDVAKVPKAWVKISGTKQVSRFHTPETIQLIQAKAQHQERLVLACNQAFASFQQEFSERYEVFRDVVQNLAVLDCLFSLATVACLPGYVKPEYVDDDICNSPATDTDSGLHKAKDLGNGTSTASDNEEAFSSISRMRTSKTTIDITNGRHPMVEQILPPGNFVPNDIQFSVNEKTMILTGPNMGGKSCYIRQVALLCIMAQIGSYLPADSARVSLLDAVFTRMGASDNIFGHESTFMVELQETSDILKMASPRSLVILDELGRGTSTLDGVAIAYAVLKHVVRHIGAITLFVTHYPSLAEVANEFPEGAVKNYHMGFMATAASPAFGSISDVDLAADTPGSNGDLALDDMDIVFLYKLVPGVSLKSYGLNVARMAKLPLSLITRARIKSKELEKVLESRIEQRRQNQQQYPGGDGAQQRLLSQLRAICSCSTADQAGIIIEGFNNS